MSLSPLAIYWQCFCWLTANTMLYLWTICNGQWWLCACLCVCVCVRPRLCQRQRDRVSVCVRVRVRACALLCIFTHMCVCLAFICESKGLMHYLPICQWRGCVRVKHSGLYSLLAAIVCLYKCTALCVGYIWFMYDCTDWIPTLDGNWGIGSTQYVHVW